MYVDGIDIYIALLCLCSTFCIPLFSTFAVLFVLFLIYYILAFSQNIIHNLSYVFLNVYIVLTIVFAFIVLFEFLRNIRIAAVCRCNNSVSTQSTDFYCCFIVTMVKFRKFYFRQNIRYLFLSLCYCPFYWIKMKVSSPIFFLEHFLTTLVHWNVEWYSNMFQSWNWNTWKLTFLCLIVCVTASSPYPDPR